MSSLPPESDEKAIEAFVEAAGDGDLETIKAYIFSGGDINAQAYAWRQTALVSAVIAGHKDVVEFLILNGADVNRSTNFGVTTLHAAANSDRLEIMEILLSQGGKASINVKDAKGRTALHCANQPKIVELLLQHGAVPTIANRTAAIPLHLAAYRGELEIVKTLLSQRDNTGINMQDSSGNTALYLAIEPTASKEQATNRREIVELLLKHGADPTIANHSGNTPFSKAKKLGKDDLAELLEHHQKSFQSSSKRPKL